MKYYSTELHCHTLHSDGELTASELIEELKAIGVKIAAITDHNTSSAFLDKSVQDEKDLLLFNGIEWSTYFGHILVIDSDKFVDWRYAHKDNIDIFLKKLKEADAIVGLAHPYLFGSPLYPGCFMHFNVKDYSNVHYIEVWSSDFPMNSSKNIKAYKLWHEKLAMGYKISAFSGRDIHKVQPKTRNYASNYVGVSGELTKENVKSAIKNGRVYVSVAPEISYVITQNKMNYDFGDELAEGEICAEFTLDYTANEEINNMFCIHCNTIKVVNNNVHILSSSESTLNFHAKKGYVVFEFYGNYNSEDNALIAFTSPIYIK